MIPRAVLAASSGQSITPVWLNERNGITFQLGKGRGRRFAKWSPVGGIDLQPEARRLPWARQYVAVPELLEMVTDEQGSTMITAGLRGHNAVTPQWKADPATAVAAIAAGLRELHEQAPVEQCPFSWSQADRLAVVDERRPFLDPETWHPEHLGLTVDEAIRIVGDPPPVDQLVVCHGDACAPNTLIADDGTFGGRVDLGALGVADRWADLAIATWSTQWNYGPGWEDELLDAYGVTADPVRTAYYRLLWDLGP
jgi:kanamycin kinase